MEMNDKKKRQSMILYVIIAIAVAIAVNQILYPNLQQNQVKDVSYSEFLSMVDNDEVKSVELDSSNSKSRFIPQRVALYMKPPHGPMMIPLQVVWKTIMCSLLQR